MTATATPTGLPLDLRQARAHARGVATWATKGDALAALAALRKRGLNVGQDIESHPARLNLAQAWVLALPDHYNGIAYLMTATGEWVPGRLSGDASPCFCPETCGRWAHLTPWAPLPRPTVPATFTHVTRAVPYHNRQERYRTKSNGSCGRWVRGDDSVALCTCGWSSYSSTRDEARSAGRRHRANPQTTPGDSAHG